jgi:hypothetical protein
MFERIVVLDGSERAERVIPLVASVEISEKDLADAANYLVALKTSYAHVAEVPTQQTIALIGRKTKNMEVKHGTPLATNHHHTCA